MFGCDIEYYRWIRTIGPGHDPNSFFGKNIPMKTLKYISLILASALPIHAMAAAQCNPASTITNSLTYYTYSTTGFNPPPFNPADIPIGGVIYEGKPTATITNSGGGQFGPQTVCSPQAEAWYVGVGTPGADNIYPTTVPNVGMRIIFGNKTLPYSNGLVGKSFWSREINPTIQLIKTGNITAGGLMRDLYARIAATSKSGPSMVEFSFATPVSVVPMVPTCAVTTKSIKVAMGQTMAATTFTGVGSTSPSKPFEIRLSCSGGAQGTAIAAYVTLRDATTPTNTGKMLSLSKGSTAAGVRIEILKDDEVLGYGPDSSAEGNTNQWFGGLVQQGGSGLVIPLWARYVQTAGSVKAGTANGVATFTMSYQ